MRRKVLAILTPLIFLTLGCNEQSSSKQEAGELQAIFPKGVAAPVENFTGKAQNFGLVPNDTIYTSLVGNVYFELGARSN